MNIFILFDATYFGNIFIIFSFNLTSSSWLSLFLRNPHTLISLNFSFFRSFYMGMIFNLSEILESSSADYLVHLFFRVWGGKLLESWCANFGFFLIVHTICTWSLVRNTFFFVFQIELATAWLAAHDCLQCLNYFCV